MHKGRFRKTKIVIAVVYAIIIVFYGLFLIQSYRCSSNGQGFHLGGQYFYEMNHNLLLVEPRDTYAVDETIYYYSNDDKAYHVGVIDEMRTDSVLLGEISVTRDNQKTDTVTLLNVIGVVNQQIPVLGSVFAFLHTTWAIAIIVVVPCAACLVYQIVQLIRSMHRKEEDETDGALEDDFESEGEWETPFPSLQQQNNIAPVAKGDTLRKFEEVNQGMKPTENESLQRFLNPDYASGEDNLEETLSEMKYKMEFQDTHQLKKRVESVIDNDKELLKGLDSYGLMTSTIENGIEMEIDISKIKNLKIRLKNDGSLVLITDTYQAEINADI